MSQSTLPRSRTRRALAGRSGRRTRVGLRTARSGIRQRFCRLLRADAGMSTVEYAIGCVAAAGFAALLYSVVTGDSVTAALTQLVQRALTTEF